MRKDKEATKAYNRQFRLDNRESLNAYQKDYRSTHREYARLYEEGRRHPCLDCGTPICRCAKRCHICAGKHKWASGAMDKRKVLRGADNPKWKGGISIQNDYVYIYAPEHKRADKRGYVQEHILVWEQAHGKPLPEGWVIHHFNGIKPDNRPSNLVGLPNRKHIFLIPALTKHIQELEASLTNQGHLL